MRKFSKRGENHYPPWNTLDLPLDVVWFPKDSVKAKKKDRDSCNKGLCGI